MSLTHRKKKKEDVNGSTAVGQLVSGCQNVPPRAAVAVGDVWGLLGGPEDSASDRGPGPPRQVQGRHATDHRRARAAVSECRKLYVIFASFTTSDFQCFHTFNNYWSVADQ